jgi:hypothetical protein
MDSVITKHVDHVINIHERIVDSDNIHIGSVEGGAKDESSDTTETVNTKLNLNHLLLRGEENVNIYENHVIVNGDGFPDYQERVRTYAECIVAHGFNSGYIFIECRQTRIALHLRKKSIKFQDATG